MPEATETVATQTQDNNSVVTSTPEVTQTQFTTSKDTSQDPNAGDENMMEMFESVKHGAHKEPAPTVTAKPQLNTDVKKDVVSQPNPPKKVETTQEQNKEVVDPLPVVDPFKPRTSAANKKSVEPRDYSNMPAEDVEIFKKCNNDAFNIFKPIYQEYKELKAKLPTLQAELEQRKQSLPDSYAEHPQAYTLTPEYSKLTSNVQRLDIEANYWQEQLAKIQQGEKANSLVLDAQGNLAIGQELEPTAQTQALITRKLMQAQQLHEQVNSQVNSLAQTHQNKYKEAINAVKQAEDKYFPFYKDPNNPHKDVIEAFTKSLPQAIQNNPLTSALAKSYALIVELNKQLDEKSEEKKIQASVKEDVVKAGPTASKAATSAVVNGSESEEDIMAMFNALKKQ